MQHIFTAIEMYLELFHLGGGVSPNFPTALGDDPKALERTDAFVGDWPLSPHLFTRY